MKERAINFLRTAFPYLLVLVLWRLSSGFWNPGGVLAFIPIFYCTFVRPVPWFGLYGAIFCFLIDYKFDTVLYWTSIYCAMYAINGFQTLIDLARLDKNALNVFMIFFGIAIGILVLLHLNLSILLRGTWIFAWATVLYLPVTVLIQRVRHD